jgi:hypothetical protein
VQSGLCNDSFTDKWHGQRCAQGQPLVESRKLWFQVGAVMQLSGDPLTFGNRHPVTPSKKAGRSTYMRSRVVESSDEDDNEDTKSSSIAVTVTKTSLVREVKGTSEKSSTTTSVLSKEITAEIYDYGDEEDDGSVLVL